MRAINVRHLTNVEFAGKKTREEVITLMKSCKALVFPSIWYEGLPLTIIEAFATGTPVIASALGAMQEMIQPGKNGLLFDPGDSSQLAACVRHFNAQNDHTMYQKARNSYLDHYVADKCYDEIMGMYNLLITSKGAVANG